MSIIQFILISSLAVLEFSQAQVDKIEISPKGDIIESQRQDRSYIPPSIKFFDENSDVRPQAARIRNTNHAVDNNIERLRNLVDSNPSDVKSLIELGNNLKNRDTTYSEGGTDTPESIWCYDRAIKLLNKMVLRIDQMLSNQSPSADSDLKKQLVEGKKGVENYLCMAHLYLAVSWMSLDMVEVAINVYSQSMDYQCGDEQRVDALRRRADAYLIMGRYEEAVADTREVYDIDKGLFFTEAMPPLIRILEADESRVPGGWTWLVDVLQKNEQEITEKMNLLTLNSVGMTDNDLLTKDSNNSETVLSWKRLQKIHLAFFVYYDKKTDDSNTAYYHLDLSQKYKLKYLSLRFESEWQSLEANRRVFTKSLISAMENTGSESRVPIFVVGFPRAGTTLLERILDAHPQIAGLGETSIFGTVKDIVSQEIMKAGTMLEIKKLLVNYADEIADKMQNRWSNIEKSRKIEDPNYKEKFPTRLVDKLNSNHRSIGMIHLLFPKALIIHIARNPMDSVFSNYKHDFYVEQPTPEGSIPMDNTCEMNSLAEVYKAYRAHMDFWEEILPGRVMNVRYEELVEDTEGVARVIFERAGLPWSDNILDFHKQKQAVNTLSSTQVRKGINRKGINYWKKYEEQLQPLLEKIGPYKDYNLTTSNYVKKQN